MSSIMIALLMSCTGTALANSEIQTTGVYSNMYLHDEGDLLGEEIFIVYGGGGQYFATIQCARGSVSKPFVVDVEINNCNVSFIIPETDNHLCASGVFVGEITKDAIIGEHLGSKEKVKLLRGNSYWQ